MNALNRLHKLLDEFEFEDQLSVRNYFIGALSCWVSESDWDRCLQSARTCAEGHHVKRAATSTDTPTSPSDDLTLPKIFDQRVSELNLFSEEDANVGSQQQ